MNKWTHFLLVANLKKMFCFLLGNFVKNIFWNVAIKFSVVLIQLAENDTFSLEISKFVSPASHSWFPFKVIFWRDKNRFKRFRLRYLNLTCNNPNFTWLLSPNLGKLPQRNKLRFSFDLDKLIGSLRTISKPISPWIQLVTSYRQTAYTRFADFISLSTKNH